ncbi:MAG TPA: family 10 glycosylhydrolase [Vicinamibacteria bacterium]|nr:family 10 glycosylhydrolase [Vicinamibacteria bacterium]
MGRQRTGTKRGQAGTITALALTVFAGGGAALAEPPPAKEVRALWVVRTSITSPEAVRQVIDDARKSGVNTLIVQVRGRGDAYYKGRWEPRTVALEDQPADFDPLAETIKAAKKAGISVHAWLNTHLLANLNELPVQPDHVYNAHPEWLAVPRRAAAELYAMDPADPRYRERIVAASREDTRELEGLYTAPSHPAVKDHLYRVFLDVVEGYDVDGVHFDYVRFPSPDFDYSKTALDRFRTAIDPTLSDEERRLLGGLVQSRPLVYVELFPQAWERFRREQITDLVERISTGVKARKPKVLVSAAVFASDEDAFNRRFQDWKAWLERGLLDVVCPMAYTPDTEVWKRQIAIARGFSFGKAVWAGIGAYRQPPESALEKIELGRRIGVEGFVLFSYGDVTRPSERAPAGDYLQRIGKVAFGATSVP